METIPALDDRPEPEARPPSSWRARVTAVVLLVLGGVALCVAVLASGPGASSPAAGSSSATASTRGTASGGAVPSAPTRTAARSLVHVSGHVQHPGVYRLAVDARVEDAVEAAGGASPDADLSAVNLARRISDGEQIHVPASGETGVVPGEGAAGAGAGAAGGGTVTAKVNLNRASVAELQNLPRIGPATAAKIVADREANGPFRSVDDLSRVSGIGEKTIAGLRAQATV
jgi:competence protein ComEA